MQANELDSASLNEASIVDYLARDPNFFVRHPQLLSDLNLPHESGRAVSLVEAQVSILRERNMEMRRRMNSLLQAARDNDTLFAKTRALTLALLDAPSSQALNEVLATHVLVDFDADFVCVHLPGDRASLDHMQYHVEQLPSARWASGSHPQCTTLRGSEVRMLFPMSDHDDSGSAVILPLCLSDERWGALCIGSRNPQHFGSDVDTLFVSYIADVLAKVLVRLEH